MPCFPGFFPVIKEVHAGGVIGGRMDSSAPETPDLINFAKFGIFPSAIHGRSTVHVAASRPITTTFGTFFMSSGTLTPCGVPQNCGRTTRAGPFMVNLPSLHADWIESKIGH